MKSTVVDESLSSFKPMYCSREYHTSTRLSQQYEKSTSNKIGKTFRRNRHHIQTTDLPDDDVLHDQFTPRKSAMKLPGYNTENEQKKKVTWSDSVYITIAIETPYYSATQHADILPLLKILKSK